MCMNGLTGTSSILSYQINIVAFGRARLRVFVGLVPAVILRASICVLSHLCFLCVDINRLESLYEVVHTFLGSE